MHNNAFVLKRYAEFLNKHCLHQTLTACVSTSPTDIHLLFESSFYLSIRFYKQHTFFITPSPDHFPKKNVLTQFKSIVGLNPDSINAYAYDRGIALCFGAQSLHIQCFGRRSGMLLVKNDTVVDHFKSIQPPDTFIADHKTIALSKDPSTFKQENPFITDEMLEALSATGFFTANNQVQLWSGYEKQLLNKPLSICKLENGTYTLTAYPTNTVIDHYNHIGEAMHDFGKLYMGQDRLATLKTSLVAQINRDLKKLKARKTKIEKHLSKLSSGDTLKQRADIIMANLHNIPAKAKSVELFDFYQNKNVTIPLKENLTAQKNAERYYQKSKNVHVEIKHNTKLLSGVTKQIEELENERIRIEASDDFRKLKSFDKKQTKQDAIKKSNHQLPYRSYHYKEFEVWVGKSARHNDALLKLAHKNDIWFHARGVAGSHVLLKNVGQQKVADDVLEFAASLAARFSKNQHESLAAVIYTNPKYVRKFKGALPGQVRVDREEVILVTPYQIKS